METKLKIYKAIFIPTITYSAETLPDTVKTKLNRNETTQQEDATRLKLGLERVHQQYGRRKNSRKSPEKVERQLSTAIGKDMTKQKLKDKEEEKNQ